MNIKEKLEKQLASIEHDLRNIRDLQARATLELAKANVLLGLQKYED